jgi:hypothetical protein
MLPLRRRYLILSWLIALTTILAVTATTLWAEGTAAGVEQPIFAWLALLSPVTLGGMLIQWGATRERMKDVTTLRTEFRGELKEITRRLDTLFELLGVNRRSVDRQRFGERIEGDDPD